MTTQGERHLGLFGATAVGVGAIVGGGILALTGVAFSTTGPSALLAFVLNGALAFLTAASFADLARRFPESGGTYAYAKKVLSVEAAFVVGWVVWFASIMAGVLYALGFSAFAAEGMHRALADAGLAADWLSAPVLRVGVALLATGAYAAVLVRRAAGGGLAATVGKVVVFVLLIGAGAWAWSRAAGGTPDTWGPFLREGPLGLLRAMGYTFVALQGFDLIAAVGGEVRDPGRNLPRSMYLSLGIALLIYVPLLFLISTVGVPAGTQIGELAAAHPESLVAIAAEQFMGVSGFWLVILAGVLSMASALAANLFGASRVAFAMARDRNLPRALGRIRADSGTPAIAIAVTAGAVALVVLAIGDVSAAGAASSLIFLISFAMVHWASILARRRSGDTRTPWWPGAGVALCLALAIFQALAVREAGAVVASWLAIGVILYLVLLAPGARLADARAEARDPDLARLRGRSPLVLVPIANPASAASLVDVAGTVRTPGVGRVLLLSVVRPPDVAPDVEDPLLRDARNILGEALHTSLHAALPAETLFTVSSDIWTEITRVARLHRCETVLLGLSRLDEPGVERRLEGFVAGVDADVVIVRAPRRWRIADVRNVLVPLGGRRDHSHLRARLLASLARGGERSVTFMRTVKPGLPEYERERYRLELAELARDEAAGAHEVCIEEADDPAAAIVARCARADLVVMGIQRLGRRDRALGALPLAVANATDTPLVLISRRG